MSYCSSYPYASSMRFSVHFIVFIDINTKKHLYLQRLYEQLTDKIRILSQMLNLFFPQRVWSLQRKIVSLG